MRLSVVVFALALTGCATDVSECVRELPPARYKVIDRGTFKSGAIVELIRGEARNVMPLSIPDYDIPWAWPSSTHQPQSKSFVLFQRDRDQLVLCEINVSGCSPTFTWLTADDSKASYRQWTVAKRAEGQCVLY